MTKPKAKSIDMSRYVGALYIIFERDRGGMDMSSIRFCDFTKALTYFEATCTDKGKFIIERHGYSKYVARVDLANKDQPENMLNIVKAMYKQGDLVVLPRLDVDKRYIRDIPEFCVVFKDKES